MLPPPHPPRHAHSPSGRAPPACIVIDEIYVPRILYQTSFCRIRVVEKLRREGPFAIDAKRHIGAGVKAPLILNRIAVIWNPP